MGIFLILLPQQHKDVWKRFYSLKACLLRLEWAMKVSFKACSQGKDLVFAT